MLLLTEVFTGLLAFVGLLTGVCLLMSYLGGWLVLSQKYGVTAIHSMPEQWLSPNSGRFNWVNYNHCLYIGATRLGLFVKTGPWVFFRLAHPPLCIPWSDLTAMTEKRVLFIRWHEVALQDHPEVIFKLNEKSAQAIKPFLAN